MINVSIIIPMYNVAQYLTNCVNSVISQNLEPNSFEVIMVDDESPDNSLDLANKLANENDFIKIISQKNKGLGGARNTGVKNAKGKYIIFLDADDWLLPNSLGDLINISNENNLDILEFAANLVSEDGHIVKTSICTSNLKVYNGIDYYNSIKYSGSACNKLYSRQFLQENKLFFLEKIYGEDFEFNTRALYFASRILAIDKICAAFLQSSNSITRNNNKEKKDKYLQDYVIILSSIFSFWKSINKDNNTQSVISFFNERLTMVNINAFYMMFKNNYSYLEIDKYKTMLCDKNLLYTKYNVANRNKNLFRKVMIENLFLFKISQPLKSILKIN